MSNSITDEPRTTRPSGNRAATAGPPRAAGDVPPSGRLRLASGEVGRQCADHGQGRVLGASGRAAIPTSLDQTRWRISDAPDAVLERRTTYPDDTHHTTLLRRDGDVLMVEQDGRQPEPLDLHDIAGALQVVPGLLEVPSHTVVAFRTTHGLGLGDLELADMLVVHPPGDTDAALESQPNGDYSDYVLAWSPAFDGLEDRGVFINGEPHACVPLRSGDRGYAVVPRLGPLDEAPTPSFTRLWASWSLFLNDMLERSIGLTTPRTVCDWLWDSTGSMKDPTAHFGEFDARQMTEDIVTWLLNDWGDLDLRALTLDILEGRRSGSVDCEKEWGWENAEFELTLDLTSEEGAALSRALRHRGGGPGGE